MKSATMPDGMIIYDVNESDIGLTLEHPFGSVINATLDGVPIDNLTAARIYRELVVANPCRVHGVLRVRDVSPEVTARIERAIACS